MKTSLKGRLNTEPSLHADAIDTPLAGPEDPKWPLSVYFSLDPEATISLVHRPMKGSRGKQAQKKKMTLPKRAVLIFDTETFQHCTAPRTQSSVLPPARLNVMMHGSSDLAEACNIEVN